MDHRRSSEAFNQTFSSHEASASDVSQQTTCARRQRTGVPCPGSRSDNAERIYILKNRDHTVSSFLGKLCARRATNCTGKCSSRSTNCSTECPSRSTNRSEYPSQDSLAGEKLKANPNPKPKPNPKPAKNAPRRAGGRGMVCPICGQAEITEPGQNMCPQCSERIHAAVSNYLQCACPPKEQPASSQNGQPASVHWQQVGSSTGNPNLNVIVLQDCQTKQELFDQLAKAMKSTGCQLQNAPPPQATCYQYQNNTDSNLANKSNPLCGCIDYEYVKYNRSYEYPKDYDYRYDLCPGKRPAPCPCSSYDDDRCHCTPCTSYDICPMRKTLCSRACCNGCQDQDVDQDCSCTCEFCNQGFESREKLAQLIAQALEIFVSGHQGKKDKKPNNNNSSNNKKKKKKKPKNEKGKAAASVESIQKKDPKQSKPKRRPKRPKKPKRAPGGLGTEVHVLSQPQGSPEKQGSNPASMMSNCSSNGRRNSFANLHRFRRKRLPAKDTPMPSESSSADSSQGIRCPPAFFLPDCDSCGSGFWARSCSKCGGGDSRRRRRARRRNRHQNRHSEHTESNECHQRDGEEDRRWQGRGNDNSSAGQNRTPGGGRSSSLLLGLSPIAHYRPGMMKFPVNYLLAGTNYRRRLVRTAAGVTLHQKPYRDRAEVKDLPSFPCHKESSHLDCRIQPPAKKWL
ncbi:hypothetical protein KR054_010151 [Drosophila jambulina]|nr:hypothetical protein KR054_010151 [Drosophila jambulina]